MIKRLFSIFILLCLFSTTFAQVFAKGDYQVIDNVESLDYIYIFESLENSSLDNVNEIHFKAKSRDNLTRWFTFKAGNKLRTSDVNSISDIETYVEPQHNTGYSIQSGGETINVWVVDKSQVVNSDENYQYETPIGEVKTISLSAQAIPIKTESAHKTQYITSIAGNDEPEELACRITTITQVRDALNENQRPAEASIDGSAPLDIAFFSNPTGLVVDFLWQIYKEGELLDTRTEENINYTFITSGKYRVSLKVSNADKSAADSISIDISESQIMAPNVFTPNGDGVNDEFRVAYTSIAEFQATIVNRWGRVIFTWTDPQKGWDGNIAGKPAPEGTYFYVIRARGSDDKPYLLKGHINLLR